MRRLARAKASLACLIVSLGKTISSEIEPKVEERTCFEKELDANRLSIRRCKSHHDTGCLFISIEDKIMSNELQGYNISLAHELVSLKLYSETKEEILHSSKEQYLRVGTFEANEPIEFQITGGDADFVDMLEWPRI